jgi:drug/metabolite transporter (DMT)-like permease
MLYPIVVTVVATCFATVLYRQYFRRGRPHQLVWSVSLSMGALAGLFFILFLAFGRNAFFFRLYYIFGALLMAAYLGLGSVFLLATRAAAAFVAAIVVLLSVIGLVLVLQAPVSEAALHGSNVEAGTKLISGPAIAFIVILNTFGAVAVVGGAIYSAWRVLRKSGPQHILWANVLIATGTLLASLAGTLARVTDNGRAFWALLALGFVVLFGGFLLASYGRRRDVIDSSRQVPV